MILYSVRLEYYGTFNLDGKSAKAHERNIKVSLLTGVAKRLYPFVLSRSDLK